MAPLPIISLISDFGVSDHYVGAMKGAILSVNPSVQIVDITHEIAPQQVEQAAFVAGVAWPIFPQGCVHIAVVDPGVGTARRGLVLETHHGWFIGPDNGSLTAALPDDARRKGVAAIPSGCRALAIDAPRFVRQPVSPTFHGRDIFGPVAAHITLGVPLDELGSTVAEVVSLRPFRAAHLPDGSLTGRVVYIDHFGNLITDIRGEDLSEGEYIVTIDGTKITGIGRTYGEGSGLMALVGSTGYLEIAVSGGNAARELGAAIGLTAVVRRG